MAHQTLERKNELLRKEISQYLIQENQHGLNEHDQQMKQRMLKEFHANQYSLRNTHSQ
ncbi:hypothetical protein [Marinicrinis sediminis]|uniref:Uncharacterized protein n=1 Tax=Marinicrinis sediminis TaxID=1652465 RepID=A0ABW5RD96_9BACL